MARIAPIVILTVALASCGEAVAPTIPSVSRPAVVPVAPLDDDAYIKGTVTDTANRPLAGARVEVLDGPQAGLSATVDSLGTFSLTGLFDDGTRFRATMDGHIPATGTLLAPCAVCHPHRWIHFLLDVPDAPASIAGDYTLTFIADSACTSALPGELRTRTYTASIVPMSFRPDTQFEIVASGGEFVDQGGGASVAGDFVSLGFGDPGLVEEVAPGAYLWFSGGISIHVPGAAVSTIAAPFDGWIDYCVLKSEPGDYLNCSPAAVHVQCASKNHRLVLTRR